MKEYASVQVTYNGKTMALSDWAYTLGLPYATVRVRYARGERDPERLLAKPRYRRAAVMQSTPKSVTHATLDDWFRSDVVERLRVISRQANISPMEVVQKLVTKKVMELVPELPTD